MRKFLLTLALSFALVSSSQAAWNAAKPADNEKLKDTPALLRENFSALQTGTDANLCINNAKMCSGAAVGDDKLAQITTPGKVSGAALTSLGSVPSSSNGQLPIANGGTGQSTATSAATALLPSQTGNSGKSLITNGTVQSWGYPDGLTIASQAQGDILFVNVSTVWARLAAGISGQALITGGAGANPAWGYPAGLNIASQAQGDIVYYNGSAWVRLAPGTNGYYLKTQGTGANPVWAAVAQPDYDFAAGDVLLSSTDAETSSGSATYVKLRDKQTPRGGVLRVKFTLRASETENGAYGRVYVNGVAAGTERYATSSQEFSEDITVSDGDLVQIYAHKNAGTGNTAVVSNFRLYAAYPLTFVDNL